MRTDWFLPPGKAAPSAADLTRLPENGLTHACMWPPFRELTGWRGLAACPTGGGAWTCRIAGRDGVFGIAPETAEDQPGWHHAGFSLHYFPTSDDPLLDLHAPPKALETVAEGYHDRIRAFDRHPQLAAAFRIGSLDLGMDNQGRVLLLRLEAPSRRQVTAMAGMATGDGRWLVAPGGLEEDVPAFDLARVLARVVAAAIGFGTGEPPWGGYRVQTPAPAALRDMAGHLAPHPSARIAAVSEALAWGDAAALPAARRGAELLPPTALPADMAADPCWRPHMDDARGNGFAAAGRRPHLTVLTGFLGAGKTTILNQMIEYYRSHDQFVAVIQNEIGASGVDQHLIDGGDEVITLDEGCVCCTLTGALAHGVRHLMERFHPEHIVLETSGLANPLNLLAELRQIEQMARLSAIVTVIDAVNAPAMLPVSEVARDQVRGADVLVVNKCDLADGAAIDRLCTDLGRLNPRAPVLRISQGRLNPALVLADDAAGTAPATFETAHHADHADDGYSAVRMAQPVPLTRRQLFGMLDRLPQDIFRIKGIVRLAGEDEVQALQCVARRRQLEPLPGDYPDEPFLVFIGRNLDAAGLRHALCESLPRAMAKR